MKSSIMAWAALASITLFPAAATPQLPPINDPTTNEPPTLTSIQDRVFGFTANGEIINPRCLDLLQTSLAESTSIILRSLVVDTCQTSELAYAGRDYTLGPEDTIYYYADPNNGRSYFGYQVLGRTTDDRFVIYHLGNIALYRLDTETIHFDFLTAQPDTVQVLTKLSESFVPCFQAATVTPDDQLIVQTQRYNAAAPRAQQCVDPIETTVYSLNGELRD